MEFNKPMKFSELAEIMGEEPKEGGRNRNLQLTRWKQYYEIEKTGHKYVVKREYEDVEKKIIEKNGKFTTYIQNFIIYKLINEKNQNNYDIRFTYRELLETLCLVNKLFYKIKRKDDLSDEIKEYVGTVFERITLPSSKIGIIYENLDLFLDYTETILKRVVKDSLKSMEQRKLIIVSKSFRLYKKVHSEEFGDYIEKHDCTDEETSVILKFYLEVMEKYHIKKQNQIFGMDKKTIDCFFRELNAKIESEFGYEIHSPTFKLILADGILETFKYEPSLSMIKLNKNIQNKLKENKYMKDNLPENQKNIFISDLISL